MRRFVKQKIRLIVLVADLDSKVWAKCDMDGRALDGELVAILVLTRFHCEYYNCVLR